MESFTPGEATEIGGAPSWQRRDWRRRGFWFSGRVAAHRRDASFDAFGVAAEWCFKLLADRGLDLEEARRLAPLLSGGVVFHALARREAYSGDADRVLSWDPAEFTDVQDARAQGAALAERTRCGGPAAIDRAAEEHRRLGLDWRGWPQQAEWLRLAVMEGRGPVLGRFFVLWAEGSFDFRGSLDGAFDYEKAVSSPRVAGPVTVFDLAALGGELLRRAGRPLVRVEIPS